MSRRDEILNLFENEAVLKVITPLVDQLIFVETELDKLCRLPLIRINQANPGVQKLTPAAKLYKDLLAQQKDIVRILCSQLNKAGEEEGESPLRTYLREIEMR